MVKTQLVVDNRLFLRDKLGIDPFGPDNVAVVIVPGRVLGDCPFPFVKVVQCQGFLVGFKSFDRLKIFPIAGRGRDPDFIDQSAQFVANGKRSTGCVVLIQLCLANPLAIHKERHLFPSMDDRQMSAFSWNGNSVRTDVVPVIFLGPA